MKQLILVRHGESQWNKLNLFTGWTDVDLSEKGIQEAFNAGKTLKENGYEPQMCYTSYLKRAIKTLNNILDAMNLDYLPVEKSWRLNEKHYGALQGLNKKETVDKYGEEQVLLWRRAFNVQSPPLDKNDKRSPLFDKRYSSIDPNQLPLTESLQDCINRLLPYLRDEIFSSFKLFDQVLVVAHGNSLRGIVKTIKNMSEEDIIAFNIPTGIPYVFELNDNLEYVNDKFIGDEKTIKELMEAVAKQGKK
ncbi:MAG: 2,3-diphosphoglycerate-dependent phosphoglycerate mutase [Bacteroidales bacterium]|jgi:2,3-bisphosphoglycerate-dependent phosphoglycerate mutase|nr:2,3-diphosphoglycerate-dependent phosphoglycerate mutase [Bacteroidales bacterium]